MHKLLYTENAIRKKYEDRSVVFHKATRPSTAKNMLHRNARPKLLPKSDKGGKKDRESNGVQKIDPLIAKLIDWQMTKRVGPGLSNMGNTCYLNSVLQCLTYTPLFAQYIASNRKLGNGNNGFCMLNVIRDHIIKSLSFKGKNGVLRPMGVVSNLKRVSKRFRVGRQEDAHEFLRLLLESMQSSCVRKARSNGKTLDFQQTIMHQVFGGMLRSRVACGQCQYRSDTFQPFLDLSLEVSNGISSIDHALKHYTMVETLDAANAWRCSGCKQKTRAKKSLKVLEAPNVLILQLKRFSMMHGKIHKRIDIREHLDLTSSKATAMKMSAKYRLHAVLVHSGGSMHSGHYFSYVRDPAGNWHEMNDEFVRWVSIKEVLAQQAYMLFYTKVLPENKVAKNTATPCSAENKTVKDPKKIAKASKPMVASNSASLHTLNKDIAPDRKKNTKEESSDTKIVIENVSKKPALILNAAHESSKDAHTVSEAVLKASEDVCESAQRISESTIIHDAPPVVDIVWKKTLRFGGNIGKLSRFKPKWRLVCRTSKKRPFKSTILEQPSMPLATPLRSLTVESQEPEREPSIDSDHSEDSNTKSSVANILYPAVKRSDEGEVDIVCAGKPRNWKPPRVNAVGLFGDNVRQWNDEDDVEDHIAPNEQQRHNQLLRKLNQEELMYQRKKRQRFWDETLDAGHVKKVRNYIPFQSNQGIKNSFQQKLDSSRPHKQI